MLKVWFPGTTDLQDQGLGGTEWTNHNVTLDSNGKLGNCLSFDTNKYFSATKKIITSDIFTICVWINVDAVVSHKCIICCRDSTTHGFAMYVLTTSGSSGGLIRIDTGTNWVTSFAPTPGTWVHIAFVSNGNNQKFYVNGIKSQERTSTFNLSTITDFITIGAEHANGSSIGTYFRGKMNDFRIYDTALSPREIKEIAKGLVVHYPLSGIGNPNLCVPQFDDAKWSAWGSSPTREKIVDSDGKTWIHVIHSSTEGYGGFACTSGSSGNGIVIDPNKKYTISVLAKTNEATTQKMVLWCHWRVAGGGGSNLAQTMTTVDVTSTPKRVYATWTPTAGSSGSVVGSINLMLGVYKNISNIYFTDIKFEEGEIATPYMPYVIGIGNIYDFESIASKWVVENSSVANYNDSEYGNVLQVTTTGADQRIYRNVSNIWTASTKYTVSFLAKANTPIRCDMSRSLADFTQTFNLTTQWERYTGIINCTTTATSGTLSFRLRTAGTAYITNITLEKGDVTSAYQGIDNIEYDVSGYKNNGTKNGNIISSSDTARYTTSSVFDGSSCIKNTNFNYASPSWTVSIWYYMDVQPSAYQCIMCFSKGDGSDANKKIAICPNSTYIWFKEEGVSQSVPSALILNQWNHIAITCDESGSNIYVNGSRITGGNPLSFFTDCTDLVIGARASSAHAATTGVYYTGKLSDFRFYATKFTSEDIQELYHTPITLSSNGTLLTQGEYVES